MKLTQDQQQAYNRLNNLKVGALFMEPGTGKTRAACELIRFAQNVELIVWLTPYQTKNNLASEIALCGGFECELIIMGIETLSSSERLYLDLRQKMGDKNVFVVCDESVKIKNYSAKRTQRIIELGKLAKYRLILNGTPITRNLLDIWAQMEFLSPKILKMGLRQYERTFCESVKIIKKINGKTFVKEFIVKFHNVEYLYSLIQPYVYECDLKLETKQQYIEICYSVSYELLTEYERIKEKYFNPETMIAKNNNIYLEVTQKLQHSYSLEPTKFECVDKILQVCDPAKVLIFCKYKDSNDACTKRYPNIKILSYGMHSYGLNLQDYNTIIYFDKTFDYAQRAQSERRIYRTGQKEACIYYDLNGNVGLDRVINANIAKKISLIQWFKSSSNQQILKEL